MAVRPIDGNELYRIEKLLDTDIVRQDRVALNLLEQVLYDIQHVPALTPPNEPLTLEQLRGMDDQPVKVKNLRYAESGLNTGVVTMYDPNDSDNGVYVGCTFFCIKDYGKIWLAYAYPPAHIDREAWRCPICSGNEVIEFKAWKTPEQIIGGPFAQGGAMFCPRCGKPRTPEAWAELKKRLRG